MTITSLIIVAAIAICGFIYAVYRAQHQERNDLKNAIFKYLDAQFAAVAAQIGTLQNSVNQVEADVFKIKQKLGVTE